MQNLPANDVLLTGSRGTGKSSIVRALLTEYKDQGLRLIEIERDDLSDLPEIQKLIQKRPEKFIVYCDDLAFNAEDENYRSLKSEPYRVCRRLNILRDYSDEKTKLYPRN
ncbi:PF05673 domain protein [Acinetobacter baumannii Naval-83]|nr:PF05673 domain protein [Acinetobacter baumannii Naval-83]KZA07088.1 hypothetical protein LV36_03779 [Acinetobacter baumannii]